MNYNNVIIYICLALSSALRDLHPLIPSVLPLICFLMGILESDHKFKFTYWVLSLFIVIDNGTYETFLTATIVRYIICGSIFYYIIKRTKFQKNRLINFCLIYFSLILVFSIFVEYFDVIIFYHNLIVALVFLIICLPKRLIQVDFKIFSNAIIFFIIGEYFLLFIRKGDYSLLIQEYSYFDSLKMGIVFPTLFYLNKKNYLITSILFLLTVPILFQYGTRLIPLSFFIVICFILINQFRSKGLIIVSLLVICIGILDNYYAEYMNSNKITSLIHQVYNSPFSELYKNVDIIRYNELILFFDRPLFNILFGSGFGSGIYDQSGILNFVEYGPNAYSDEEITTSIFFGFHDYFTDIGIRFGLIFTVLFIFNSIRLYFNTNNINYIYQFLITYVSLFSISGYVFLLVFSSIKPETSDPD